MQIASTSMGTFVIPGAYNTVKVQSNPTGAGVSGNIIIIGEADGGVDFTSEDLKNNFFSPDQADKVASKYLRGPIVDAMRALSSPSADADITGSPNRVYILKTNASSKASASIVSYGSLTDKNSGVDGNKYAFTVSEAISEIAPSVSSTVLSFVDPSIYDGLSFSVRLNGAAASIVTLGTGTHASISALIAEIAGLLPSGITCVAGAVTGTLEFKIATDSAANAKGWGKSFELIDSTSGDLATLGVAAQLYISSAEPQVQLDLVRTDNGTNESFLASADVALQVGYVGTSATMTITSSTLSTTVVGGAGASLSISLSSYSTISDLAAYINSQTGYSASVVAVSTSLPCSALDQVSAIGICCTVSSKPGRVKKSIYNFKKALSSSSKIDASVTATAGLPGVSAKAFFSGGLKGATTAASIVDALAKAETLTANFVIPLFSRDASEDITDALTDSASTYTIDAVHASCKSHVLKMSTSKIKKNRQCFLSVWDTFANAKSKAASLANARVSLCMQKASQVDSQGNTKSFMPWYAACVAAGMQAGGFYKGITNKLANIISYTDPSGFDSGSIGDLEAALEAGLLILNSDVSGDKWVSDQTTYGVDSNFVLNSIQTMYASDLIALDLTQSLQTAFVGKSLSESQPSVISGFVSSKMDAYRKNKLIVASTSAPLGYRALTVKISGPVLEVSVSVIVNSTIYFIPLSITIEEFNG